MTTSGFEGLALAVYGRLEVERALNWTLEELGELAQVVRRGESRGRVEEELGRSARRLRLAG